MKVTAAVLAALLAGLLAAPASARESEAESPEQPADVPKAAVVVTPGANVVSGVLGAHLAVSAFPIYGVQVRHILNDEWSIRGGLEAGGSEVSIPGGGFVPDSTIKTSVTRISGAFVSNGVAYWGGGFTLLQVSSVGSIIPASANLTVIEPIVGLRSSTGNLDLACELRAGLTGPSTLSLSLGGRL